MGAIVYTMAPPVLALQPPDPKHNLQMTFRQVVLAVWERASHRLARYGVYRAKTAARKSAAITAPVDCGHLDRRARPCAPHPSTDGTEASRPRTCGGRRPSRGALWASLSRARHDGANRKYGVAPSRSTDLAIDRSRHHLRHPAWPALVSLPPEGLRGPQ